MVVFRFWDRTWDPFRESKMFFSQNLTYSYSFMGWNLPGITMSLESLHNYFGITVKSRKNDEKFGFFDFCCDSEIMMKWLQHHSYLHQISPQQTLRSTFFSKKKKFSPTSQNGRFRDFETEPETPFGNRQYFFLKISVTRTVFRGEINRELPCRWNHYIIISGSRSKVEKTTKNSVFSTSVCDPDMMM